MLFLSVAHLHKNKCKKQVVWFNIGFRADSGPRNRNYSGATPNKAQNRKVCLLPMRVFVSGRNRVSCTKISAVNVASCMFRCHGGACEKWEMKVFRFIVDINLCEHMFKCNVKSQITPFDILLHTDDLA